MRALRFRKLTIRGFKCYRKATTFDIGRPNGLYFWCGENQAEPTLQSNGAGKSSAWDAFCWVIKGRTIEGLRTPDLKTWNSDKPIFVELLFDDGDQSRSLARSTDPNLLQLDGEVVGQDVIDAVFGNLTIEALEHTVIHAQNREFFFDLAPAKKMELLSDVLDLERWEERSLFASKWSARLEARMVEAQNQQSDIAGRRQEIEDSLKTAEEAKDKWSAELKRVLERIDVDIGEEETVAKRIARRRDDARLAVDSAGTEAKGLERAVAQLEVYWGETTRQRAEKQAVVGSTKTALAEAREVYQFIREHKECPTCQQAIDQKKLLPKAAAKGQDLKDRLETLRGEETVLVQSESDLKDQLDEARSNLRRFRAREEEAQTTLNTIEPDLIRRQTRLRMLREERRQKAEAPNPYIGEVKQYRARLAELAAQGKEAESDLRRYAVLGERVRFWIKGFKDVRLYIIQEALAQMQLLANGMIEESGLVGWSIEYVTERTTKSDTVKMGIAILVKPAAHDKPVRWESFSGGERQRLKLIGSRALAEVLLTNAGLSINMEVYDEPTKGLSPRGIDDLVAMLADQARWSNKTIFFTDHHAMESDRFASVIKIVRDKNGSYVE